MAIIITKAVTELFDPNVTDASGGFALLSAVNNNDPEAARLFGPRPFTFSAEGTSLGDEALTLAALQPVNLTGLGVTVPAGTMRNILTRLWSKKAAATNAGYRESLLTVQGAAAPTLPTASTLAGALENGSNDTRTLAQSCNNNNAAAPQYAGGILAIDGTNLIVGVQNFLGSTGAATATAGMRWRLEVLVSPLVTIPVFV